jgi:hypothetical protein
MQQELLDLQRLKQQQHEWCSLVWTFWRVAIIFVIFLYWLENALFVLLTVPVCWVDVQVKIITQKLEMFNFTMFWADNSCLSVWMVLEYSVSRKDGKLTKNLNAHVTLSHFSIFSKLGKGFEFGFVPVLYILHCQMIWSHLIYAAFYAQFTSAVVARKPHILSYESHCQAAVLCIPVQLIF